MCPGFDSRLMHGGSTMPRCLLLMGKAVLALAFKLPRSGRDIKSGPGHVGRAGCFMEECESAHPVHHLRVEPLVHAPSPVALWQPVFTGTKRLHF